MCHGSSHYGSRIGTLACVNETDVTFAGDGEPLRDQGGLSADETELDAFVERLGGKHQSMIDPWSAPVRWLQRLRGRPTQTTDFYAIPHGAERAAP